MKKSFLFLLSMILLFCPDAEEPQRFQCHFHIGAGLQPAFDLQPAFPFQQRQRQQKPADKLAGHVSRQPVVSCLQSSGNSQREAALRRKNRTVARHFLVQWGKRP